VDPRHVWTEKLKAKLPALLSEHPALALFAERATILLHGSTCRGVDDPFSDLDLYFILSAADLAGLDRRSPVRFLEFRVDGKAGHFNACAQEGLARRVEGCDLPLISELRTSIILHNGLDAVTHLLEAARTPMPEQVRRACFFFNYYQMRNFHRASDNPMERGDAVAVLFALSHAVAYALRSALVLDGQPYPYEKWLHREALRHPTGQQIAPYIEVILDEIAVGTLRVAGPERQNPLSSALRQIRQILIDTARANNIDEAWLTQWWLYIDQAETATAGVRWR
jgi:hypothetical protein